MYNHRQGYPSLPSQPLPHHYLHFHPHGYRPYYYSTLPQPVQKFYTPTHVIQQQQYQQYQSNRQRQSSNNTYRRTRSTNKKEPAPDDTPNSMISNTIRTKPTFSFIRNIKATTNWVAETFCFCFIDDNSYVIEMNDRQTNVKNTLKK